MYFSFNLGAVVADLIVHHQAYDTPQPADIAIELFFAFPIMIVYFVISLFD